MLKSKHDLTCDRNFKRLKKITAIIVVATVSCFLADVASATPGPNDKLVADKCHQPPREPKGLLICGFLWGGMPLQYRVYCPNKTVRNITNGHWGEARTAFDEDYYTFGGSKKFKQVIDEVCL